MTATTHRQLVDVETLVARSHYAALIAEAMLMDRQTWIFDNDDDRRETARRVAWTRWRFQQGWISG